MSTTLADEFLADLDEGEQLPSEESEEEEAAEPMEEDNEGAEEPDEKDEELERKLLATLKNEDITKVASLLSSNKFKHLIKVCFPLINTTSTKTEQNLS